MAEIEPKQGANQDIRDGDGPKVTRTSAARAAGFSDHQRKTATHAAPPSATWPRFGQLSCGSPEVAPKPSADLLALRQK
jgi:hypothetical protein